MRKTAYEMLRSLVGSEMCIRDSAVVISVVFIAIFADFIAPYSPIEQYRGFTRLPPAWIDGGNWAHPLGTAPVGRDMLSRLLYGSRISLFLSLIHI